MITRRHLLSAGSAALTASAWAAPPTSTAALPPKEEFKSDGNVPRPSPEYAVKMLDGKQILFSQYKGKVLAVEFLLTTCPHCQRTAEAMQKLYTQYGPQGFQVLGVAINIEGNQAAQDLPKFIRDHKLTFPVGLSPNREGVYEYLQRSYMDRLLMPQMVFIDRKFVIQVEFAGDNPVFLEPQDQHLQAVVKKVMKPAAPSAASATRKTK